MPHLDGLARVCQKRSTFCACQPCQAAGYVTTLSCLVQQPVLRDALLATRWSLLSCRSLLAPRWWVWRARLHAQPRLPALHAPRPRAPPPLASARRWAGVDAAGGLLHLCLLMGMADFMFCALSWCAGEPAGNAVIWRVMGWPSATPAPRAAGQARLGKLARLLPSAHCLHERVAKDLFCWQERHTLPECTYSMIWPSGSG